MREKKTEEEGTARKREKRGFEKWKRKEEGGRDVKRKMNWWRGDGVEML
jgi:hypothetical protein